MPRDSWNEEKVSVLNELFLARLSAQAIADRMGISRCAVIGKLNRLGLSLETARMTQRAQDNRTRARVRRWSGLPPEKPWSQERLNELAELAAKGLSSQAIANRMGKSQKSVVARAAVSGIKIARVIDPAENDYFARMLKRREAKRAAHAAKVGDTYVPMSKTSPILRNRHPRLPEMSKNELRNMLAEAVRNTRMAA
ncbi:GcrA family cell cycle regulator (plasmid) [Bradyrhizobium elkanii]|uniref:GcrA family cell cycle regulator n=1 Tax=Bradyrhizobium elkanii TaxID=29448 RepID=UPI00271530E5|nr:GcrA family cell cycle regulator [Bradyrhizobium elkanii]WLB14794.1 GcrA family cell cycle regulator [Bradyrhizobium elkanii]WLB69115.1 GcrA family cell cycle regulator [Bradyrhizobium elkanii]